MRKREGDSGLGGHIRREIWGGLDIGDGGSDGIGHVYPDGGTIDSGTES